MRNDPSETRRASRRRRGQALAAGTLLALASGTALPVAAADVAAVTAPPPSIDATLCPAPAGDLEQRLCYVVQQGDWLWKIARAAIPAANPPVCATSDLRIVKRRANELYRLNRAAIGRNPNLLRPGTVLVVAPTSGVRIGAPPCVLIA